jgi:hypothetical protein
MKKNIINDVREQLLRGGVAAKYVSRAILELDSHYEELVERATSGGLKPEAAESAASDRIGETDLLIANFLARPELKSMTRRHPVLAHGLGPLAIMCLSCALAIAVSFAAGGLLARPADNSEMLVRERLFQAFDSAFLLSSPAEPSAVRSHDSERILAHKK